MPSAAGKQLLLISVGTSTTVCLAASAVWLYWQRFKTKNAKEKEGDEGKVQQQKCVQMQAELWCNIVHWLPAPALAQGLSLVNRQLHQICAPKMYEQRPHVVNAMAVQPGNTYDNDDDDTSDNDEDEGDDSDEEDRKKKIVIRKRLWDSDFSECRDFPAPEVQPTPNILGFRKINFRIINDGALAFLRNIVGKFAGNSVPMCLEPYGGSECNFKQLLEFHDILQGKAVSLFLDEESFYDLYWKHCRPFLLSLQFLTFDGASFDDLDLLCAWLQTRRADDRPRYFYNEFRENCTPFIHTLRELFLASRHPCAYIVEFDLTYLHPTDEQPPAPFSLQNGLNERLVLGRHGRAGRGGGDNPQMLVLRRFPAMAATVADDWMQPHLTKARRLFCRHVRSFRHFRMDDEREEEVALNELVLTLNRVSGP